MNGAAISISGHLMTRRGNVVRLRRFLDPVKPDFRQVPANLHRLRHRPRLVGIEHDADFVTHAIANEMRATNVAFQIWPSHFQLHRRKAVVDSPPRIFTYPVIAELKPAESCEDLAEIANGLGRQIISKYAAAEKA